MGVKLGNGNWAVKEDKLLAYNDKSGKFFNKEFDFTRGSSATYVAKDGLIKTSTGDTPRIDFTDSPKGALLLEPSSTNIALNSEDLTNNSWFKWNSSASSSNIINPEGNTGASLYTCSNFTGSNQFFRINPNTAYATSTYTYSMFVKYNTFQFCKLAYTRYNVAYFAAIFDIINGTVTATDTDGNVQNANSNIEDFGNGWFRISITAAIGGTGDGNFEFNKSPSATPTFTLYGRTSQTTTTNDKVYIWGVQVEQKPFATSYIPTYGTTATRLAETCDNSGSEQDFNSEEGVLYLEAAALSDTGTERRITITDGDFLNLIEIRLAANGDLISFIQDPALNNNFTGTYVLTEKTEFFKCALKWKANDYAFYVNGVEVATNNSITINQTGLDRIDFSRPNQTTPFYGKVKNLRVFKRALSDTELYLLTSEEYQSYQAMATALNYTI